MATRQYIGARYVPKFYEGPNGTDWTANTAYEPLTIVTRNGNSYTSKKLVPASVGAPESNADYWASTGIYNAQVQELRQDIDSNTERIETLETESDTYEKKRRFILIGDSYGQGWNGETDVRGWCEEFKNVSGLSASDCYIYAQGGAGFAHTPTFLSELQNLTVNDPETITDIIVGGGYNDHAVAAADESAAMTAFYNYCKANYPNARVWLCFMGASRAADGTIRNELNAIKDLWVRDYRYSQLDNTDSLTQAFTPFYGTDDFHLSQYAYEYIGNYLWSAVHGGRLIIKREFSALPYSWLNDVTSSTQGPHFALDGHNFIFRINHNFRLTFSSTKPTAGSWFDLATFSSLIYGRNNENYAEIPFTGKAHFTGGGGYKEVSGSMSFMNKTWRIVFDNVEGSAFMNLSNCDYVQLRGQTTVIDSAFIF